MRRLLIRRFSVYAAAFPVGAGSHAGMFFENPVKMRNVIVAAGHGNVNDQFLRIFQKNHGILDADLIDVMGKRDAVFLLKDPA